jgi:hypothetical protein
MFDCSNNQLTTLKGGPEIVGLSFNCAHNLLKSLEGAPHSIGLTFSCGNNASKFTKKDVQAVSKIDSSAGSINV